MIRITNDVNTLPWSAGRPSHHGHFCCAKCHKKFQGCERVLLSQQAQTADTIPDTVQTERLQHLLKQERARQEQVKVARDKRVEMQGLPAVRKMELAVNRTVQSRMTEILENDPAARTEASKKNREKEEKQIKAGGKPKKSGTETREIRNHKKSYPPSYMDKLTLATQIWAREYGQEYVD
jgi:hypothetical protein